MPTKVVYIIDENRVNRDLIERLMKNEFGSLIIKRFDSCESGFRYLMEEQRFLVKEYPDSILLSGSLSPNCISRFLEEVENFQPQLGKPIQVHMMLDPNSAQSLDFKKSTLVSGIIERPICPQDIFNLAQSLLVAV
ncbi:MULTISPECIES: hypothetical protein [unclassified Leeuwenhoekiella]|uniref:hypothetical protein n=1 Tax=unclassified Leeuwenhoekiella TaxID=2615029 RepID=UPI000C6207FE|nr:MULTISPECIES: hypothetical protein [unclassified Leeuwenhoekiella]MAW94436.1 hypothetical protein [Leeuwenhoekiella sp.]MBA81113.1 hypothetical protein [Leeuwenhoekiella sp.]|tara:strand:+ start:8371 stop:8778 length:408 start_codon:yes stop_codon:yes gene_type:complete